MADETPPRSSSGRKIPVPMPVLIGIVVAIGAGIYLMRRNKTAAAAAQPAAAPAPVVMAGQGGGGISSGLLYALLQNLQSSPQTVPAGSTGTGATTPGTSGPPNVVGMTLQQAQQALQAAGYSVTTVEQQGISGQRFASTLTPQQVTSQASQPVVAVQPGTTPNTVTLWTNPS